MIVQNFWYLKMYGTSFPSRKLMKEMDQEIHKKWQRNFYWKENMEEKQEVYMHYKGKNLEVLDVIDDFDLNFCLGNCIKHVLKSGKTGNKFEDLHKALWYLQREISACELPQSKSDKSQQLYEAI